MMPARKEVHIIFSQWKILNSDEQVPVEDVENPIQSQEQHVVGCNVLDVLQLVDDCKLRQDGESLQPDRKGPDEVHGVERLVDQDRHQQGPPVDVVVGKRVRLCAVAQVEGPLDPHQVHGVGGEADEEDLHQEQVQCLPPREEVDVPEQKDREVNLLRFVRQTYVFEKEYLSHFCSLRSLAPASALPLDAGSLLSAGIYPSCSQIRLAI
jgi:hypothetical protein